MTDREARTRNGASAIGVPNSRDFASSRASASSGDFASSGDSGSSSDLGSAGQASRSADSETVRIPIVEEQVVVGKREVETGRVHVRTHVEEKRETLSEMLERDVVEVERVPMNIEVPRAPQPFEDEHGVYVVPIVEERLVVEKRLFVVEELHIRRKHSRSQVDVPVTRRVMRAEIDRGGVGEQRRSDEQRSSDGQSGTASATTEEPRAPDV